MNMKLVETISVGLVLLASAPLWSQDEQRPLPVPAATGPVSDVSTNDDADRMQTPPPVSGQSYPTSFTSGERSNYLRGGLAFPSAYTYKGEGPGKGVARVGV